MMQRCYNPKHHQYKNYGLRGIVVCDAWHDPKNFIAWAESSIGVKEKTLTVDRIDNHGNYSPENCRWATVKQQTNNRRTNIHYTIAGVKKTFTEWCNYYGISDDVVWERINKLGWPPPKAFATPLHSTSKRYRLVEIDGITRNVSEWCREYGITRELVYTRVRRGLSLEEAITRPIKKK